MIDHAKIGQCHECGDDITLQDVTEDQILAKKKALLSNGGQCDRCEEGSTAFEKQAKFQIVQWLGPIEFKKNIASVLEPQNASHAVVTLKDGRTAKIFRKGESTRELREEVGYVFTRSFLDLKKIDKPWEAN